MWRLEILHIKNLHIKNLHIKNSWRILKESPHKDIKNPHKEFVDVETLYVFMWRFFMSLCGDSLCLYVEILYVKILCVFIWKFFMSLCGDFLCGDSYDFMWRFFMSLCGDSLCMWTRISKVSALLSEVLHETNKRLTWRSDLKVSPVLSKPFENLYLRAWHAHCHGHYIHMCMWWLMVSIYGHYIHICMYSWSLYTYMYVGTTYIWHAHCHGHYIHICV